MRAYCQKYQYASQEDNTGIFRAFTMAKLSISSVSSITGCAVAPARCVNGDWLCQWESAIFDPLHNRHPSTDHQKIVTGYYAGASTAVPN